MVMGEMSDSETGITVFAYQRTDTTGKDKLHRADIYYR
jgi:hypothetical protein